MYNSGRSMYNSGSSLFKSLSNFYSLWCSQAQNYGLFLVVVVKNALQGNNVGMKPI